MPVSSRLSNDALCVYVGAIIAYNCHVLVTAYSKSCAALYSIRCMAVGTAMTSPLAQSNTFEFIEYVITQPLKRNAAKQWADFVCITCAINVCVLKELFRVDPPILELLPTPTCRQVRVAHLSQHRWLRAVARREPKEGKIYLIYARNTPWRGGGIITRWII